MKKRNGEKITKPQTHNYSSLQNVCWCPSIPFVDMWVHSQLPILFTQAWIDSLFRAINQTMGYCVTWPTQSKAEKISRSHSNALNSLREFRQPHGRNIVYLSSAWIVHIITVEAMPTSVLVQLRQL